MIITKGGASCCSQVEHQWCRNSASKGLLPYSEHILVGNDFLVGQHSTVSITATGLSLGFPVSLYRSHTTCVRQTQAVQRQETFTANNGLLKLWASNDRLVIVQYCHSAVLLLSSLTLIVAGKYASRQV